MTTAETPLTRMSLIGLLQEDGASAAQSEAQAEFFTIYHPVVHGWCLMGGLQPADADDVSQDVTWKLFRGVRSYKPEKGRFRHWLRAVVSRAVIDCARCRGRLPRAASDAQLQTLASAAGVSTLQDEVDRACDEDQRLAQAVVARVRARVQPQTWDVFYRCKVLGTETAAQVAASLGVSANSVNVAINRIQAMLREERVKLLATDRT